MSNNLCLNEELIKNGYAWVYKKYCKDDFCTKWLEYEQNAQVNKSGLWSGKNPVPPWEFRHQRKVDSENKNTENIIYHGNLKSSIFHKPVQVK